MSNPRAKRLKQLFEEAADLPVESRDHFLAEQCSDDASLRGELTELLRHDAHCKPEFLEGTPDPGMESAAPDGPPSEKLPASIGPYEIVRKIGEGGMGVVYEARQSQPQRTVALKVMRPGLMSRSLLRRFRQEAQAMGQLQHPGIAQIFEAGIAEDGEQPYFVMELVRGKPLTEFAASRDQGTRDRLALMAWICNAVQHAHERGIIHRDLKPSNILVDENGQPKILDFGVARVTDTDVHTVTLRTDVGQLIGTIPYMSPEQVSGDAGHIDSRSDVYSLGVILFELLGGRLPIDLRGKSIPEAVRLIRDEEPSRLSSINPHFRGDIETIVSKALEKDKDRRYASAADLGSDLLRYLNDEPVVARPATAAYRFRKFARRNKALVIAGTAVFVALAAGVVGTTIGLVRATTEANIARAVNDFLNNDVLAAVSPDELGNDASMRKVIEVAAQRVEGKFPGQPQVEAAVRLTLGRTFRKLADLDNALKHLEHSRHLREETLGADHPATLESCHEVARVFYEQDRCAEAEALFRGAFEGRRRLLGADHAETIDSMYWLSVTMGEQGRYVETEKLMTEALRRSRRSLGAGHRLTVEIVRGVGVLYVAQDDWDQAGPYYEEAYRKAVDALGPEHPTTLLAMKDLSAFRNYQKRYDEAAQLLTEGLAISRRMRGEKHPATLNFMSGLATNYRYTNRIEEAERLYLQAIEISVETNPDGHSTTTRFRANLAQLYDEQKMFEKAEPLWLECIAAYDRSLGPSHPFTITSIKSLIAHYEASGETDRAQTWMTRLQAIDTTSHDEEPHH